MCVFRLSCQTSLTWQHASHTTHIQKQIGRTQVSLPLAKGGKWRELLLLLLQRKSQPNKARYAAAKWNHLLLRVGVFRLEGMGTVYSYTFSFQARSSVVLLPKMSGWCCSRRLVVAHMLVECCVALFGIQGSSAFVPRAPTSLGFFCFWNASARVPVSFDLDRVVSGIYCTHFVRHTHFADQLVIYLKLCRLLGRSGSKSQSGSCEHSR